MPLGSQYLCLQRRLVGDRYVDRGGLIRRRALERLGARQHGLGVRELGLELLDGRLLGLHVGFERSLVEAVEQLAFLDLGAFGEQHLLEIGADAGDDVDPVGGEDAPGVLGRLDGRLTRRCHHADGRRWTGRLLGNAGRGGQQGQRQGRSRSRKPIQS